jgi:hypothetical protein
MGQIERDREPSAEFEQALEHHYANAFNEERMTALAHRFMRYGLVRIADIVTPKIKATIKGEVERLLDRFGERRDMQLKSTDYTSRKMTMVEGPNIGPNSLAIWSLYNSPSLNRVLSTIAREAVYPCPDINEELFMARQERKGDTHGLHWGDYSFALIWILQAPPIETGGLLQCVPHTTWNKEKPRINEILCENPIDTYYFASGDIYFLRTDTTLHGTVPLREDATRLMFNMTYAGRDNRDLAISQEDNWWSDATQEGNRGLLRLGEVQAS